MNDCPILVSYEVTVMCNTCYKLEAFGVNMPDSKPFSIDFLNIDLIQRGWYAVDDEHICKSCMDGDEDASK